MTSMRKVLMLLAASAALAGCGSSGISSPAAGGSGSSERWPACTSLVGKPVGTDADVAALKCASNGATIGPPGSFGCQAHGTAYYFPANPDVVYGVAGGNWLKGSSKMSITEMAAAVGC